MVLLAMTLGILCALMVIASSTSWTSSLTHAHSLETWWTVIPTSVILLAAAQTITVLYSADILGTSETLHVVASQWYWTAGSEQLLDLRLAAAWTCTATIATTSQSNEQLLLGTLPYISSSELAYTGLLAFEGMAFLGVGWTLVLARVAEPTILDLSQGILMAAGSLVILLVVTLVGGLVHRVSWVQG